MKDGRQGDPKRGAAQSVRDFRRSHNASRRCRLAWPRYTASMLACLPPSDAWRPPRPLADPADGVLLWWCATSAGDTALPVLVSWLSDDERARMARFAMPALGRRYAIGRAGLRYVLGTQLALPPADVPIVRGPRGRPFVAAQAKLDFNVSNTRDVALIGVARLAGARIGVDVEHRERVVRHEGLARKFCTAAELAHFARLDDDARRQRFLRLWTCKEAMSKATGDALGAPLRRLEVALEPVPRLVAGPPPYTPEDWRLFAAAVPDDYVATAALWRSPDRGAAGRTR